MTTALRTSVGYGRRVGLHVAAQAQEAVAAALPFWWAPMDLEPERTWDITSASTAESAIRDMELWVAEHAVDRTFVHAGVVVVDGRALLLPGRSMAGKTTLTAALLRAGATYGSDEYAVLDAAGQVHPYPRPLSVRRPDGREAVSAVDLGAAVMSEPVQVHAVAALSYRPGATWTPTRLAPGAAALRLLDNTVSARSRPEAAQDAVTCAAATAHAIETERGDADATAALLLDWLAGPE